jgi:proline iminopeptidase
VLLCVPAARIGVVTIPSRAGSEQAPMIRADSAYYPPLSPHRTGHLAVDDIHSIYWEESGNPDGVPLVVLHGGPGGSIRWYHNRIADPGRFRIVAFDQRGCGKSTPFGSLVRNTTQHLVSDMDALREHLGIEKWIVLGGSWGSALGLAYAETHPGSCLGLIISGVIVERREDLWWWWHGARFIYPEVWETFRDALPPGERDDLRGNYVRRVLDPDPAVHGLAAAAWLRYEAQTLDVWPDRAFIDGIVVNEKTIGAARIFAHYDAHNFFLEEEELLHNAHRLAGIPGSVINGRFDMCTPPRAAYDVHKLWPGSEFIIVPGAGHRWQDELLANSVARAIVRVADIIGRK